MLRHGHAEEAALKEVNQLKDFVNLAKELIDFKRANTAPYHTLLQTKEIQYIYATKTLFLQC